MHHATNENMAEVMGWERRFSEALNKDIYLYNDQWLPIHLIPFNPIADLNHAALVEARLRELELIYFYYNLLHAYAMLTGTDTGYLEYIISAPAQTRCDAAWAAYAAWKEQQT